MTADPATAAPTLMAVRALIALRAPAAATPARLARDR